MSARHSTPPAPLGWAPEYAEPALAHVRFTGIGGSPLRLPVPFLGGSLHEETWLVSSPATTGELDGVAYVATEEVCFARVATTADDDDAAESVYRRLLALQANLDFPHLLRVWHYLGRINEGDGDRETYKRFCLGRARALAAHPEIWDRLPAATVVGQPERGLEVHALLVRRPPRPIENPRQVSAYRYPRQYGPRQPTFARAVAIEWDQGPQLLVSGTASIVGHETRHRGEAAAQTRESLDNVMAVLQAAGPVMGRLRLASLDCLKVYLRHIEDLEPIRAEIEHRVPGSVPVAYLQADLCRHDLLMELETQVTSP